MMESVLSSGVFFIENFSVRFITHNTCDNPFQKQERSIRQ